MVRPFGIDALSISRIVSRDGKPGELADGEAAPDLDGMPAAPGAGEPAREGTFELPNRWAVLMFRRRDVASDIAAPSVSEPAPVRILAACPEGVSGLDVM